jgi:hypothetical protein
MMLNANFTWSHNLDYVDSAISNNYSEGTYWTTRFESKDYKGPASYDIPVRLAVTYMAKEPWKTHNRAADAVVAGWTLSGTGMVSSGFALNPVLTTDNENTGAYPWDEYPNLVGNPKLAHPTAHEWFNTAAFAVPPMYTRGNCGRNIIRGSKFKGVDVALTKQWPFKEKDYVEFRLNVFNLFNQTQLAYPDTYITDSTFGRIDYDLNAARYAQFSMKVHF